MYSALLPFKYSVLFPFFSYQAEVEEKQETLRREQSKLESLSKAAREEHEKLEVAKDEQGRLQEAHRKRVGVSQV